MSEGNTEVIEMTPQVETPATVTSVMDASALSDEDLRTALQDFTATPDPEEEEDPYKDYVIEDEEVTPPQTEQSSPQGEQAKPAPSAEQSPKEPEQPKQPQIVIDPKTGVLRVEGMTEQPQAAKDFRSQEQLMQQARSELEGIGKQEEELTQIINRLQEGLEEEFVENPARAVDRKLALQRAKEELSSLGERKAAVTQVARSQILFNDKVPTAEQDWDGMYEVLASDGLTPQQIAQVKTNPFLYLSPGELISTHRRAKAVKMNVGLVQVSMQLLKERDEALAKVAELEKKGSAKQIVKQIQKVAAQAPSVNGGSGSGVSAEDLDNISPGDMTDEQLHAALVKRGLAKRKK